MALVTSVTTVIAEGNRSLRRSQRILFCVDLSQNHSACGSVKRQTNLALMHISLDCASAYKIFLVSAFSAHPASRGTVKLH